MNHAGFCHASSGDPQKEIGSKWRLNAYRRIPYLAAIRKLRLYRASVIASPYLTPVPPPTAALPPPSSGELDAQDAVRQREAERVKETAAAVALARMDAMNVKAPAKRKDDTNDEVKDDQEDDEAFKTPPKKAAQKPNEKKRPASPSLPSPPAKSVKAEIGKEATKAKVELTHTKCRSYWLVRVTGRFLRAAG